MKKEIEQMSNLDKFFLEKAIKETPNLRVRVSVPKSQNKGFSDLPLFDQSNKHSKLF